MQYYDLSSKGLKPYTVSITPNLLKSVKCARRRSDQYLEDVKNSQEKEEKKAELVTLETELQLIQSRCSILQVAISSLDSEFISLVQKAEERNDMLMVGRGNSLKRTSEEKRGHLSVLEKGVEELKAKKKKLI